MKMKVRRVTSGGVEVAAHGKVNLILRVLDRRPDGYHNLWSVMQAFDLADTVVAEADGASGIHLVCEGADLPADSTNLAYRAAERVLARLKRRQGIRLLVHKRLPVAAGVGGGSSDAAATIQALATLFETGWSQAVMAEVGQEVGSDVPFFFYGPTALVEGRGERVSPLRLEEERWLLLVNPGIAISTAWAYEKLAAVRATGRGRISARPHVLRLVTSSAAGEPPMVNWKDLVAAIENDFAPVMEQEYPVLRDIRLLLLERDAQAAMLSGSGSTVFGVFSSERSVRTAADGLDQRPGWRVWVTRTCRAPVSARLTT
jgi:4-diphosphocytidyl-2-C-methyl-D-erythritol kinase